MFNDLLVMLGFRGETQEPTTPQPELTVYEKMCFCPVCGSKLSNFVVDTKECPRGCGFAHPDDNREGLPVITFELRDKTYYEN